jgi:predicted phage terminase large subunit-like protein
MKPSLISPQAAARELLRRRLARASLVGYAQAIEIPGKPVDEGDPDAWMFAPIETGLAPHHLLILQAIERTAARRNGRLMVFCPPGSAKSTYCSVVAPSYLMGRQKDMRVILASYATPLARRHGRRARQVVKSPGFASIFGCGLSSATNAADEWALSNGSEYLAGGILSGITGNRAHGLFIDDPIKGRRDAESQVVRESTWGAYTDDLLTRLIPGGFVVLVQTRWHEDDLAGRILPKNYNGESGLIRCTDGQDWDVINLPAQCERSDDPLGRAPGEYLWPEWFDEAHWQPFKQQSRTWSALFQQRPRPDEGGVFKHDWCRRRYGIIPVDATTTVHSWDTAQKENEFNDPSGFTSWRLGRSVPGYYLAESRAERRDYPSLRRWVINLAERDKPAAILIEDKSSGSSLIQDLRNNTSLPIIAIEPDGGKLFRAGEVSAQVEAGLVHLPEVADWLTDFENEFFAFPLSTHDDRVDSTTQFLKWVQNWSFTYTSAGTGARESIRAIADVTAGAGYSSTTRASAQTRDY